MIFTIVLLLCVNEMFKIIFSKNIENFHQKNIKSVYKIVYYKYILTLCCKPTKIEQNCRICVTKQ